MFTKAQHLGKALEEAHLDHAKLGTSVTCGEREAGRGSGPLSLMMLLLLLLGLQRVVAFRRRACWKGLDEVCQAGTGVPDIKGCWQAPCMRVEAHTLRALPLTIIRDMMMELTPLV